MASCISIRVAFLDAGSDQTDQSRVLDLAAMIKSKRMSFCCIPLAVMLSSLALIFAPLHELWGAGGVRLARACQI